MDRRSFLQGTAALALGQLLFACQGQSRPTLSVKFLKNSVPAQLLQEFQRSLEQSAALDFDAEEQLSQLFDLLKAWKQTDQSEEPASPFGGLLLPRTRRRPPTPADLMTLGDYWLAAAIQQQLIRPLEPAQLDQWSQLPSRWQALVTRDRSGRLDPQGQVWGAPYRWASTVIVYRVSAFEDLGWIPQDWADLWRPELQRRLSLLDSPRSVIGLTLKKLGQSLNTENLNAVPTLKEELRSLHQQVKFYSSDTYLQPLITGNTWAAVGWSTDVLPLLRQNRQIAAVVPRSGTILSADLWVHPAANREDPASSPATTDLLAQWIDFCWRPQVAPQLSLLSLGTSPIVLAMNRQALPNALQDHPLLLPDSAILEQSEFLTPLSEETATAQWNLWVEMRQTG